MNIEVYFSRCRDCEHLELSVEFGCITSVGSEFVAGVDPRFANRKNAHFVVDSTGNAVVVPTRFPIPSLAYCEFLLHVGGKLPRPARPISLETAD